MCTWENGQRVIYEGKTCTMRELSERSERLDEESLSERDRLWSVWA